jgi:hypothetical protein
MHSASLGRFQGWVANDVEVEQVLDDHHGGFAAYVQVIDVFCAPHQDAE